MRCRPRLIFLYQTPAISSPWINRRWSSLETRQHGADKFVGRISPVQNNNTRDFALRFDESRALRAADDAERLVRRPNRAARETTRKADVEWHVDVNPKRVLLAELRIAQQAEAFRDYGPGHRGNVAGEPRRIVKLGPLKRPHRATIRVDEHSRPRNEVVVETESARADSGGDSLCERRLSGCAGPGDEDSPGHAFAPPVNARFIWLAGRERVTLATLIGARAVFTAR